MTEMDKRPKQRPRPLGSFYTGPIRSHTVYLPTTKAKSNGRALTVANSLCRDSSSDEEDLEPCGTCFESGC